MIKKQPKEQPERIPPLSQLYIYTTNSCNCSCKHCWIFSGLKASKKEPSHFLLPETFEATVVEAKRLGLSAVKWTGGEPTIHPDFPALLNLQKKHGLNGRVETNGMEVSLALAKLLLETGVTHVAVSLDGISSETHNAIRGTKGAYRRTLRGIKNLVEAGFKPQLIMTLMAENVEELEGLLTLAEKVGAGSVKLNLVQPTLRGEEIHLSGQALSIAELIEINRRLEKLRQSHRFPIFFDIPMAFRPLSKIFTGDGCSVCGIKTILGLLADGSYALCGIGENLPELVFGRAGRGELEEIWKGHPTLQQIRSGLPKELKGICSRCLMAPRCLGSCVAQNYYRNRDLSSAFWFCEKAEEEGLFPKTRLHFDSPQKKV